ncbi:hypothetical protein ABEW05_010630 [Botrytis cinerea]
MCTINFIVNLGLWLPARGNIPIIIFALIYSFASGTFVSLAPTIVAQITSDMRKIGTRTGSMFALASIAALIGNLVAGALASLGPESDQYRYLPIFTAVTIAIGTAILVFSKSLTKVVFFEALLESRKKRPWKAIDPLFEIVDVK